MMMEQCHQIIQKLMPLMDETAPRDVLDGILKVQAQQMKLAGVLQGNGISGVDRQAGRWQQRGGYHRAHQGGCAGAEARRAGTCAASAFAYRCPDRWLLF